jgi:hypothetical protein
MDYLALQFADIAATTGSVGTERFSVSMNYPKLELTEMNRTLESLVSGERMCSGFGFANWCLFSQGLHPRGMLYVQDLDA